MNALEKINTYASLGIMNLADVFFYRLSKKLGLAEKCMPLGNVIEGCFFHGTGKAAPAAGRVTDLRKIADSTLNGSMKYFSHEPVNTSVPPAWRSNLAGIEAGGGDRHWSLIPDFDTEVGDIKQVWEPSRFDWLLVFCRAYCLTKDITYLQASNDWLVNWSQENPVNGGPNWKCGQEASIRLMQMLLAGYLVGEHIRPEKALVQLVVAHCQRIVPTLRYAMAQDNNHGTSEAAALFVAGAWLQLPNVLNYKCCSLHDSLKFETLGRKWLENRVCKLIEGDGSFSQYSVNYHRVMLDTLSIAEFWRNLLDKPVFSPVFYQRAKAATLWLHTMTHPETGDVPNLGANDGARLFVLCETDYRDFRPSVQLASTLFLKQRFYPSGVWDEPLIWLQLPQAVLRQQKRKSRCFSDGGYSFINEGNTSLQVYLRFPRFRFRPSHSDLLHLDLWWKGDNIVRDGGTYSYNNGEDWLRYFSGTESHSTVQFDDRDQMPRVSRFLFGRWIKPLNFSQINTDAMAQSWNCSYRDGWGAYHKRSVYIEPGKVIVRDSIKGFKERAILRWRLCPGDWKLDGNLMHSRFAEITVTANSKISRLEQVEGKESRYYNQITSLPVLEAEVNEPTIFESVFILK